MRRKTGILIGLCVALVLIGTAGAATWTYSREEGRPVGTWHDAPGPTRMPVSLPEVPAPRLAAYL
jgi:lysyl endopeptidase